MTDEQPEEPPRSPEESRRLRRWIWVMWIAAGVFLLVQAIVNPIILNFILVAVWLLGNIAQLIVTLHQRKSGSGHSGS
ncbi:hypothetical protein [Curtobacterium sp. MCBD17_028]|uniref:hypothetical protein n=1 Tax=Curtobacterium sp. MCBD17_028 TaxID=2175670 RepID=UPI000DA747D5|nr:hypothetical protein [Curtobacterium sp. MCBD17_028]PZE29758.1 hypothetical protein DEI86_00150 [Curtobacterium sp. MCBD17_028]